MKRQSSSPALFYLLCLLCAVGFLVIPYLIFFVAPTEATLGLIQKIFYFHVPCAWAMFLSALLCAAGAVATLFMGRRWGDHLVAATAELTVVFGTLVLITGPLWARKAWGRYWDWDVRLTTVLVLFLVFVGVLLARRYGGPAGRRIGAGLALFGAADVPLVYISVKLWRTIHPETTVVGTLPSGMRSTFFLSLALFTLFYFVLLWLRLNLERSRSRLDELMVSAAERELGHQE
jgi:heme exporter protein C